MAKPVQPWKNYPLRSRHKGGILDLYAEVA